MGIYPGTFLSKMEPTVNQWIQQIETKRVACAEMEERPNVVAQILSGETARR
jgi:hypothetical protein